MVRVIQFRRVTEFLLVFRYYLCAALADAGVSDEDVLLVDIHSQGSATVTLAPVLTFLSARAEH